MPIQHLAFSANHLGCGREERLLFKPISFNLKAGEALSIEGVNGVGKTTLLRVLAGLLPAACGQVDFSLPWHENVAYLGPHNGVKGLLTPVEYLKYYAASRHCEAASFIASEVPSLRAQRGNPGSMSNYASEPGLPRCARNDGEAFAHNDEIILEKLQLKSLAHKPCATLSSGQKQRVALARIVLSAAPLWILDEPTTALDKQGEDLFSEILSTHLETGGIAIIATHQMIPVNNLQKKILESL